MPTGRQRGELGGRKESNRGREGREREWERKGGGGREREGDRLEGMKGKTNVKREVARNSNE